MDRHNWPWRKRSSEKSPAETESSSSISSHSERLSDGQTNLTSNTQSPEVASTTAPDDNENEKIKALTDELSAALLSVTAKAELVKQHAKVAEEAVAGWERAEKEVSSLKLQLDAAVKKNSALDGALKECVRQLRQGREEQELKIEEGITKRALEWESRKSDLENQLSELRIQLEAANSEASASNSIDGLFPKLEAAEKENASMRVELVAMSKKLEVTTLERDLSTHSAETASKQHLESVKKVAKLEAECRKLRFLTRKASLSSEHRSVTGSSSNVDSLTDSQSDYGERLQATEIDVHKTGSAKLNESEASQSDFDQFMGGKSLERKPVTRSLEIVLMDDFLEMEKLAALPGTANGPLSSDTVVNESPLKAEVEKMISRNAELEERIRRLEAEKLELEMELNKSKGQLKDAKASSKELEAQFSECQAQLRTSHGQLKTTKAELISLQNQLFECQDQLRKSQAKLKGKETELIELQTQLIENEDQLNDSEANLRDAEAKLEELQNQLNEREDCLNTSQGHLKDTEASLMELHMKLIEREEQLKNYPRQLENSEAELTKLKAQLLVRDEELKRSREQAKYIDFQLLEMQARIIEYQDKLEKSQGQAEYVDTKLFELQTALDMTYTLKEIVEGELEASNARREEGELQVKALESEVKSLTVKVESLVDEADKERALSAEMRAKCLRLEDELSKRKLEPQFQLPWNCNTDMKAEQEKELAVAASKFEECQRTIASLGRQLQSLATLDDFLEDADSSLEFSGESPIFFRTGEFGRPPSIDCQ